MRLLISRQGRTDCFHSGHLGRSGELPEKEKSRPSEIPLRQSPRPRRKNGRPLRARRETQTETAEEVETLIAARSSLAIAGALLLASASELSADDLPLKTVKPFTYVVDYEPFWSPDGRQIVLISSRHGGMKVHVMDANDDSHGSTMHQLTTGEAEDDSPAWSPDGKKIVFVSIRAGVSQICIMNVDGSGERQLTSGS